MQPINEMALLKRFPHRPIGPNEMIMENKEYKPTILLRKSTDEDFDFVFELNKTNMRKYVDDIRGWNDKDEREDMKKKFTAGLDQIIQVDGQDIGVLRVLETEDAIKLDHIELLPKFQNIGVGRKIIKDLTSKNKPVSLQVLKQNPAVKLYKELGFKIVGETDLKYQMATKI